MQVRNLRNRLRVNMVCEWAWISIPGERDIMKSLNWCSRLELRSHVQVCTYARTHTGKRAHVLLITMELKQKQKQRTLNKDVAVIQWLTSCHKNRMTTRYITLGYWRVTS